MLWRMIEFLLTLPFIWSWLLVFPVSVGMEWNGGNVGEALSEAVCSSYALLQDFNTIAKVQTNLVVDSIFTGVEQTDIRLTATLNEDHTSDADSKGCGRSTYNTLQLYDACGFKKITKLIPTLKAEDNKFVKDLTYRVSQRGSLHYVFDGGTAVRFPAQQLPRDWFSGFSISGWIFPNAHDSRQYIASWSEGSGTLRQQNMGFFLKRRSGTHKTTFGFFYINEEETRQCTKLRQKWKVKSRTLEWSFITLMFVGCHAKLFVNGHQVDGESSLSYVHVPQQHLQPKFVIGARWEGGASKFADYFRGEMSGLVLLTHETMNQSKQNCLLECKDGLSIPTKLPPSITEEHSTNGSLTLHGSGGKHLVKKLLDDIVYVSNNEFSSTHRRHVTITATNVRKNLRVTRDLTISINKTQPSITIFGKCGHTYNKTQSVKLCDRVRVVMKGCTLLIDSMLVHTDQPLQDKRERLYVSETLTNKYGLKQRTTEKGFVVHGIKSVENYSDIVQNIRYRYLASTDKQFTRKISISLTAYNGLVQSNTFEVVVIPSKGKILPFGVFPMNSLGGVKDASWPLPVVFARINKVDATERGAIAENQHGIFIIVFASVALIVSMIPLLMIGVWRRHNKRNQIMTSHAPPPPLEISSDHQLLSPVSEFIWDDEGLSACLKINAIERVSISNNPYVDILSENTISSRFGDTTADGSLYSDEDDDFETDFDNDSIRQLEWDCLQNSLCRDFDDDRCSSARGSRTSELFPDDIFL